MACERAARKRQCRQARRQAGDQGGPPMTLNQDDPPLEFAFAAYHWDSGGDHRQGSRGVGQQLQQQRAVAQALFRFGALQYHRIAYQLAVGA
ncbi:MAG: hypothetical protein NT154_22200, partial [Verrucomicrobia bacterium]|nr:hypothetical protein [Verrucomicrobiota bacterium]